MDYRQAGVNIEAGEAFVKTITPMVRSTFRKEVLGDLGGFGGLFRFPSERFTDPVLVSGTDGVGTKLKLAFLMDRHDTIGIDLVAMCVNDIVVSGAEPLFFLDYLAVGSLSISKAESILKGLVLGCQEAGCALIGGETAEMPSFYGKDEYELAGFAVGVVERSKLIDGKKIRSGDVLLGVASTGLHSNGFSLARKILLDQAKLPLDHQFPDLDDSMGNVLLTPTKIYVKFVLTLLQEFSIHGIAHITGGGLPGNIPRILPTGCVAEIRMGSWNVPSIFRHIEALGHISQEEMFKVFNMGIGLVLIVPSDQVEAVLQKTTELGEKVKPIGRIISKDRNEPCVEFCT